MAGPLIDCPLHGIQEDLHGISFENSTNITIIGSTSSCPVCGRPAPIVSGVYGNDPVTGGVTAVLSPTPGQLRKLMAAVEWAQVKLADAATDPEVVARKLRRTVEDQAPELVKMVDRATEDRGSTVREWIAIVIALMSLFVSMGQGGALSENDVLRLVDEYIEQTSEDDPKPSDVTEHSEPRESPSVGSDTSPVP